MRICESPSARKVWIEIVVAMAADKIVMRHLPRGRCGLKFTLCMQAISSRGVTFREEGVD